MFKYILLFIMAVGLMVGTIHAQEVSNDTQHSNGNPPAYVYYPPNIIIQPPRVENPGYPVRLPDYWIKDRRGPFFGLFAPWIPVYVDQPNPTPQNVPQDTPQDVVCPNCGK